MIGSYLDEKIPLLDAVKKTLSRLEGTWGLVIMGKDFPDQLIVVRPSFRTNTILCSSYLTTLCLVLVSHMVVDASCDFCG